MRIGLIDVDGHNYPNIPLMKLSAWHKAKGDTVTWYDPMFSGHMDKVYMSKVFSFSPDYEYFIDADEIVKGGSGYCISLVNGKEVFDKSKDIELPYEIEHIYPDYSLYGITDTAYGFLSRGCPRGCSFCHVEAKEGRASRKVADLNEFWNGQKNIVLCDPNILACRQWKDLLQQLIDSKARVDQALIENANMAEKIELQEELIAKQEELIAKQEEEIKKQQKTIEELEKKLEKLQVTSDWLKNEADILEAQMEVVRMIFGGKNE